MQQRTRGAGEDLDGCELDLRGARLGSVSPPHGGSHRWLTMAAGMTTKRERGGGKNGSAREGVILERGRVRPSV